LGVSRGLLEEPQASGFVIVLVDMCPFRCFSQDRSLFLGDPPLAHPRQCCQCSAS
jgi:hypothetical protein